MSISLPVGCSVIDVSDCGNVLEIVSCEDDDVPGACGCGVYTGGGDLPGTGCNGINDILGEDMPVSLDANVPSMFRRSANGSTHDAVLGDVLNGGGCAMSSLGYAPHGIIFTRGAPPLGRSPIS